MGKVIPFDKNRKQQVAKDILVSVKNMTDKVHQLCLLLDSENVHLFSDDMFDLVFIALDVLNVEYTFDVKDLLVEYLEDEYSVDEFIKILVGE